MTSDAAGIFDTIGEVDVDIVGAIGISDTIGSVGAYTVGVRGSGGICCLSSSYEENLKEG